MSAKKGQVIIEDHQQGCQQHLWMSHLNLTSNGDSARSLVPWPADDRSLTARNGHSLALMLMPRVYPSCQ